MTLYNPTKRLLYHFVELNQGATTIVAEEERVAEEAPEDGCDKPINIIKLSRVFFAQPFDSVYGE